MSASLCKRLEEIEENIKTLTSQFLHEADEIKADFEDINEQLRQTLAVIQQLLA
ncbi:hypothetical protein GOP56_07715 [Brevibacillus sp. 7WMA2]|uniref:Uncharacterized protein n=1 Tax=Brevibacillus laterosporus LMG 15441 TaxID=1042163 RepID=A0A075RD64_BRELA|nr:MULTISPECIES: hypothetical protein [Brevibacillus]AIG27350.1 hypothetical protein BRLA_c030380 [Brevibacillus laterosporus LMG 15441]MBA4533895.1 hypothetical protein [Brevibacillus halotolerans]MCR8962587.1 hypothetical protein [Brevibacillus laterosporus]MCZ0834742.1 hypothetical protein [Brevibacillus halotolerans]QIC05488.1 hypothetical protein GOP56_07715 [Brevibacillus sp. 7WMA2]